MIEHLHPDEILDLLIAEVGPSGMAKIAEGVLLIRYSLHSPWVPYGSVADPEEAAGILDGFFNYGRLTP